MNLREELAEAKRELVEAKAANTLSGDQLIKAAVCMPIIVAFTSMSILIVLKAMSNPAEVIPFLEKILLAFAIIGTPTTIIVNSVIGKKNNGDSA